MQVDEKKDYLEGQICERYYLERIKKFKNVIYESLEEEYK